MREGFEQFRSYLWVVIHHRWLALISAIVLSIAGWNVVEKLPDKYEVETRVFINTDSILKGLLKGIAADTDILTESAMIMRRTLITRPNLLQVAQQTEMDLKARTPQQLESIINGLRSDISIGTVSIPGKRQSNLYSISYSSTDPKLAKKVVEAILDIFVENILGISRKDSDDAGEFLDEQIVEYEIKLSNAEQRLKLFKQENAEFMPDKGSTYQSRLTAYKTKLEEVELQISERVNQAESLRKQLDQLASQKVTDPALVVGQEPDPLDKRIENIELQLDSMSLRYTDNHPDVISAKRSLEDLKKQKEEKQSQMVEISESDEDEPSASILNSEMYQEIKILLGQTEAEIAALRTRANNYQGRIEEMESKLSLIPEIEARLTALDRDYGILKNTHDNLVKRKTSAELGLQADQQTNKQQFNIVEPPVLPLRPSKPDRIMLSVLVLLGALAIGVALVLFYEQIKPTFYTHKQIEDEFDIPVVGYVSMNWSTEEITKRRIGMICFLITGLVLLGGVAFVLNHHGLGTDIGIRSYLSSLI